MKKKIILSFLLLFLLFLAGIMTTLHIIDKTTANLTALLLLHKVEVIRQDLVINVQTVQSNLYTTGTSFGKELDIIVENGLKLQDRVQACMDCHHEEGVEKEIGLLLELTGQYQEALSYFITSTADPERVRKLQSFAADIGDRIIDKSQWMAMVANESLRQKTTAAMAEVAASKKILIIILVFFFGLSVFISLYFIRSITGPVAQLLRATRNIKEGRLQYRIEERLEDEFRELADSFNEMGVALGKKEDQILASMRRLDELHKVTLSLHGAHDLAVITAHLGAWLAPIIDAEKRGILLRSDDGASYHLHLYEDIGAVTSVADFPAFMVERLFRESGGKPLLADAEGQADWPLSADGDHFAGNGIAVWLVAEHRLEGALVAMNSRGGRFEEAEIKILGIFANNLAVAMVNMGLYRDVTRQMEELRKTQQQLVQAEKLTAVGTLASGIAHDFNNILCGMLGYVALLKRALAPENSSATEMLGVIEQAGFRAANLTKQLLTFSRRGIEEKKPVNLNEKVSNVINLFEKTVSKLVTIRTELACGLPAIIGDSGQIEQVIMNLCVNARDAMPEGGTLTITTRLHRLSAPDDLLPVGDYVRLCINDTGTGMDSLIVSRIFDPFFTTKELGKGTGLGLAMVYGIVSGHGGTCRVTSSPGQGTTFIVDFPVTGSSVTGVQPLEAAGISLAGYGALIVDDETNIVSVLEKYLIQENWVVYTARNGQEAVDVLTAHPEQIQLVVLDVNMPVMGGEEAFIRLKELQPGLKVLVVSGYNIEENVGKIIEAGADGFLQKPFRLEEFIAKINGILQEKKGEGEGGG